MSLITKPGTPDGPCLNDCYDWECKMLRQMAESHCGVCHKPIGYDTEFSIQRGGIFTHYSCKETINQ